MAAEQYRQDYALSLIDKFPAPPRGRPFPQIEQAAVITGLRERVKDPHTQDQKAASLCGPAAFFFCILNFKPELYVQYVIDLFNAGKAQIGSLKVEPSIACRAYKPPADKIAPVDWIALASLRDSENPVLNYESADDTTAGITRPANIADWLRAAGYQAVHDNTNYYFCKGLKDIQAFDRDLRISRDVCLLVNDNILVAATNRLKSTFCDHWIVLESVEKFDNSQIAIKVYSWGSTYRIPDVGFLSIPDFCLNFYGFVSGKPKYGPWC